MACAHTSQTPGLAHEASSNTIYITQNRNRNSNSKRYKTARCALPSLISWPTLSWNATCCTLRCVHPMQRNAVGSTATLLIYGISSTQTGQAISSTLPERQPGHAPSGSKAPSSFDSHRYTTGTAAPLPAPYSLTRINQTTHSHSPSDDRYLGDILISSPWVQGADGER